MYPEWIERGLQKPGKNQEGLAAVLGLDRSVVSKVITGARQLKAAEIPKVAKYLGEPPPDRTMPVHYKIGAGQVVYAIDDSEALEYEQVAGMWGIDAELAVVTGDSMWPAFNDGSKLFFGVSRPPSPRDHREMRVVKLADDRMLVKIMRKTADPTVWTLESLNAPPIEDVVVVQVAEIIRIEPRR